MRTEADMADEEIKQPTDEEREALRRFEEEIARLTVTDHVTLMMQSLPSLAAERLGMSPETAARKDLEQARLAIDAFKALLGVLEGRRPVEEMTAHRAVLSQLQVAYVAALDAPAGPGADDAVSDNDAAGDAAAGDAPAEGTAADEPKGDTASDGGAEGDSAEGGGAEGGAG